MFLNEIINLFTYYAYKKQGDVYLSSPELQEVKKELQEENKALKLSLEKLTEENINLKEKFDILQKSMNETIIEILNKRALPKTCSDIYQAMPAMNSGIYTIFPSDKIRASVYCEVSNNSG